MPNKVAAVHVADEVLAVMARKHVSRARLATAMGVSLSAVSRRLSGTIPFDIAELAAVAEFLGVPMSSLMPNGVNAA
jgi:transcriptional regulator with XRE-family HTH domain